MIIRSEIESTNSISESKFVLQVTFKASYLNSFSSYQQNLLEIIKLKRSYSWTFEQIGEYLTSHGYLSSRGNSVDGRHVFDLLKKYEKKCFKESFLELRII